MNGRMYDPQQGRFLSPDNHIQDPFNTQNFNRYGYVLNNPLTLTDPSGEFFWVAVAFGAFFGGAMAAMQGGDFWDILGGALIGGIAAGLGAGLGNLAAQGLGFAGTAAGFFGNAALSVSSFGAGFAVGFAGGFASGFVGATGNALMKGQKFGKSLLMGLKAGLFSGVAAGVTAGVTAGLKATKNGGNFWSGKGENSDYWKGIFDEMGGDISRKRDSLINESIPGGHKPTDTGQIADTLSTNPGNPNADYGKYGWTRNGGARLHKGVDYVGDVGDNVYAMYDGKVSRIWNSSSYGPNAVRIQSSLNGKLYNVDYGHMSSQNVWVGQSVRAGETIGQIGRLGKAFTGGAANLWPTHVHISVWRPIVEGNSWYRGFVQPWW